MDKRLATRVAIIVSHKVRNFESWKVAFDSTAGWKPTFGWKRATVLVDGDDADTVIVIEEFAGMEQARAFAQSPELKKAMLSGGIIGTPEFRFCNLAGALAILD